MTAKYGKRNVAKMIRQINALRLAIRSEGTEAIQSAWDDVEEHIDYAYRVVPEGWQPIETAPKVNMETILLHSPEGTQLGFWSEGCNDWITIESWSFLWATPTHWKRVAAPE